MIRVTRLIKMIPMLASIILVAAFSCGAQASLFVEDLDAGLTIDAAVDIGSGVNSIRGELSTSDNNDFYQLTFNELVEFAAFNLVWDEPNPSNSSISLYDAGGSLMDRCSNCFFLQANTGVEVLNASLSAGDYFLEVRDTTPGNTPLGGYQLDFSPLTTLAKVPEPATAFLLSLGLAGLIVKKRSLKNNS